MKIEILAPAGSMESVYAAVRCGAGAVYLGGKTFSARANAANFSDDELREAVRYCHLHGVAVHRAINTVVFDDQLDEVLETAVRSAEIGVDAFIIQDLGVLSMVHKALPDMPLHASTQMSLHTPLGAEIARSLGCSRVVLSRELSLESIAEICKLPVEVEVFVHGALCMSVSGQCYMSAMIGSRSANRGLCAQACRLPMTADGTEHSALSLKDLSYVNKVGKLAAAGVASLKIEGRMKRPEYVAAATNAVKSALNDGYADIDSLRAVFSRSGFTDGYLEDKLGAEMFGTREREDVVSAKDVFPQLQELYRAEIPTYTADFHFSAELTKPVTLTVCADGAKVTVTGDIPSAAQNKALDEEQLARQLSKLGGTTFSFGSCTADIDGLIFVSAAQLNDLRRRAVSALEEKILEKNTPRYTYSGEKISAGQHRKSDGKPKIRVYLSSAEQLSAVDFSVVESAVLPLGEWRDIPSDKKIFLAPPRFITDEKAVEKELSEAKENGFGDVYCNNLAHIELARRLGMKIHGGYGLNVTNSLSADVLAQLGAEDFEASFEMKLSQISHLSGILPRGIIAYGRLPMMLTRNCPIKSQVGCGKCGKLLTDRTGREFPVACTKDYAEILNAEVLYMADRLDEIRGVDFITLMFHTETAEDISRTISQYKNGADAPKSFTRGLYYRGIL